ncbi:hypothetical protein KR018_007133 [Drosophila ironensis]|nr:hypothetical protein KR018_007133 [Drosophila ironensis]
MLKWAVNQPRNSYLAQDLALGMETGSAAGAAPGAVTVAAGTGSGATSYSEFHVLRMGKLKRKSLLVAPSSLGKENQLTSTPLPTSTLLPRTPLLKDLSNILATPQAGVLPSAGSGARTTAKYACTLPTFEAEYSPSAAVIPGPLIALRGVGIPDSYFEKPRYLDHNHNHNQNQNGSHNQELGHEQEQKSLLPPPSVAPVSVSVPIPAPAPAKSNQTMSSNQMGDVTLELMIDAILESNRKAPGNPRQQPRQHLRQRHRQRQRERERGQREKEHLQAGGTSAGQSSTPTYQPAFDPASDLREYWKESSGSAFEEREVCSPLAQIHNQSLTQNQNQSKGKRLSLQLRRQRVVRRKRKIANKISSSVRQSAQKLLAAARSGSGMPAQKRRHISPDSGHNSTSDFDEEAEARGLALDTYGVHFAEASTKRRLSFSFSDDVFVEK